LNFNFRHKIALRSREQGATQKNFGDSSLKNAAERSKPQGLEYNREPSLSAAPKKYLQVTRPCLSSGYACYTKEQRERAMRERAERPVFIDSNELEDVGKTRVEGKIGRSGGGGGGRERLARRIIVWGVGLTEK
jgi:hypothetical protein